MPTSSNRYATPLTIELEASAVAMSLTAAVHALAAIALFLTSLPVALAVALLAVVAANAWLTVFRLRFVRAISWRSDGRWLLSARNGTLHEARLCSSTSLVTPCGCVLNFAAIRGDARFSVVILRSAANAEALRRLRVRLTIEGGDREGVGPA